MTKTSQEHFRAAAALRDRILSRQSNERPTQAWAGVARECAKALDAHHMEMKAAGKSFAHRSDLSFISRVENLNWSARAQVETLAALDN